MKYFNIFVGNNTKKYQKMKKITLLITLFILAVAVQAQVVSFEEEEGYSLGNIDGQNNWVTTSVGEGEPNIDGQEVTSHQGCVLPCEVVLNNQF